MRFVLYNQNLIVKSEEEENSMQSDSFIDFYGNI